MSRDVCGSHVTYYGLARTWPRWREFTVKVHLTFYNSIIASETHARSCVSNRVNIITKGFVLILMWGDILNPTLLILIFRGDISMDASLFANSCNFMFSVSCLVWKLIVYVFVLFLGYPGLATHIHGPRPPYPTQMNTFSHPAIPPSPPPRTSSRSNPTSPTSPTKPSVPTSPTYMNNEMLNRKRRRDAGNGNDANIVKNGNTPSNNSPYYDVICNPTDRMENGGHHFGPGASQPVQGHHFSPVSSQPIQGALKAKLREKRRIQQLKPHTAPLYPLCEVSPERTSTTGASSSSLAQSETPSHVSSLQESRGDTASPVTNCTYGQDTNSVILESNDTEITI